MKMLSDRFYVTVRHIYIQSHWVMGPPKIPTAAVARRYKLCVRFTATIYIIVTKNAPWTTIHSVKIYRVTEIVFLSFRFDLFH